MYNFKKIKILFEKMNYKKIHSQIISFIKEKVRNNKVIIGLSGGIDSSLTCSLAVDALGVDQVSVLIIKNIRYPNKNLTISRNFAKSIGIERKEIDSNNIREHILSGIPLDKKNIRQISSLDARITDLLIRTMAAKNGNIYLGTINGTERLTGWYPKGSLFGDLCPIGGLLKHQIRDLAQYQSLPKEIIKSVSLDSSKICSGCGELPEFTGIPYEVLDAVLYTYETKELDEHRQIFSSLGISQKVVRTIFNRIGVAKNKSEIFSPFPIIN